MVFNLPSFGILSSHQSKINSLYGAVSDKYADNLIDHLCREILKIPLAQTEKIVEPKGKHISS